MLRLDHLAISAGRLEDGVAAVEDLLGVPMAGGGKHAAMGTHNRLLGLGDLYLEVIAIDPEAPAPGRPRWFDLDRFSGGVRMTNWIVACDDITAELAQGPPGWGEPMSFTRGDYRWQMAIPDDGCLPFDGCFPALIQWQGALHPTAALPDHGLRLKHLILIHPMAQDLQTVLQGRLSGPPVVFADGPAPGVGAVIETPKGLITLH